MVELIIGAIMIMVGVYAVVKAEINISPRRIIKGTPCRIIGILLISGLPLVLCWHSIWDSQSEPGNPYTYPNWYLYIGIIIMGGLAMIAFIIGIFTSQTYSSLNASRKNKRNNKKTRDA